MFGYNLNENFHCLRKLRVLALNFYYYINSLQFSHHKSTVSFFLLNMEYNMLCHKNCIISISYNIKLWKSICKYKSRKHHLYQIRFQKTFPINMDKVLWNSMLTRWRMMLLWLMPQTSDFLSKHSTLDSNSLHFSLA